MSEFDDWDDEDQPTTPDQGGTDALRNARAAAKANAKKAKELEEKLTATMQALRERSVKDVLTAKGMNPAIAKVIPADLSSEDEIAGWVTENSELFGVASPAGSETPATTNPQFEALQRIAGTQASGTTFTGDAAQAEAMIRGANTEQELQAVMAQLRG